MEDVLFNDLDPQFKDQVAEKIGLEAIKPCFTCGSCTAVCPVRAVIPDFDPRLLIHEILVGMRSQVLSSDLIWFCCLCNSCFFVCPQGIKFSRIASELRKMAAAEGYVDSQLRAKLEVLDPYLQDLCRRAMFSRVKQGFSGRHTMPCWRKHTR